MSGEGAAGPNVGVPPVTAEEALPGDIEAEMEESVDAVAKEIARRRPAIGPSTWATIKRTAPDLYFIALLILILGVALALSSLLPFLFELPFTLFPVNILQLGSVIQFFAGVALVIIGTRLLRRERAAWVLAEFVLFFALLANVLSATLSTSITAGIVLFIMIYLYLRRDMFVKARRYTLALQESIAFSALVLVIIYGVVGGLYISDLGGFDPPMEESTDALYFTIDTITTVGKSDPEPTTAMARWFSISLMVLGISTFLGAVGVVLVPYIERRVKGVLGMFQRIQEPGLKDHIIVCGKSDETALLVEFLEESGQPFVVVSRDRQFLEGMRERGIPIVVGDPAIEENLTNANIEQARALVAIHEDDAENAFVVVTARGLRPEIFVIAMARSRENVPKLKKVGANNVVATGIIVTRYIGRAAITGHGEGAPEC